MIKIGIVGGRSQIAGELIRLLVHHPEVELRTVFSPAMRGKSLSSLHRGIVGDTDMRFSDSIDLASLDLVFITEPGITFPDDIPENLKYIIVQEEILDPERLPVEGIEFVPGVSEMFRKPLVRGARGARILPAHSTVALIVLFPLALHLLLNNSLNLKIEIPEFYKHDIDLVHTRKELESILNKVQLSFDRISDISSENSSLLRTVALEAEFDCNVSEEEIVRIYNDIYDDHNFTFLMRKEPIATEVAGTQKCLLYVSKPEEGKVRIKAVADAILRGGAGDAIHSMNLLFGLHEKTGLTFPASMAFRNDIGSQEQDVCK